MSDPLPLAARISDLANSRVLCVGDVMLDRFVYGEVSRISPEAPIPVFRITREVSMLGGAGNVVRNATALGPRRVWSPSSATTRWGASSPAWSAPSKRWNPT